MTLPETGVAAVRKRTVREAGRVLPPAMIGMLVIYCLKDVQVLEKPRGADLRVRFRVDRPRKYDMIQAS